MPSRLQERYTPGQLDEKVVKLGGSLARVLVRRISNNAKTAFPEARSIHVSYDSGINGYYVAKVVGVRNATLWHNAKDNLFAGNFTDNHTALNQLLTDLQLYIMLKPSTMRPIGDWKHMAHPSYSIALTR